MQRPLWSRAVTVLALTATMHSTLGAALPSIAWADAKGSLVQRGADLFDDQQYEESIQTLTAALLRPGTSRAEKIEVYRLLAYNYITLKRSEEADAAVRGLLALDETFKLGPNQSPRFRDFFDTTRKKWEQEGKPGKLSDSGGPKQEAPVTMKHTSPAQVPPGTAIKLACELDDPSHRSKGVQLLYRQEANAKFTTIDAALDQDQFRAEIPSVSVTPPFVEYYFLALDKSGLPTASRGDAAAPLRVVVPAPQKQASLLKNPWFWIPVGAAVVGGVVAAVVVASSSSTSSVTINIRE